MIFLRCRFGRRRLCIKCSIAVSSYIYDKSKLYVSDYHFGPNLLIMFMIFGE